MKNIRILCATIFSLLISAFYIAKHYTLASLFNDLGNHSLIQLGKLERSDLLVWVLISSYLVIEATFLSLKRDKIQSRNQPNSAKVSEQSELIAELASLKKDLRQERERFAALETALKESQARENSLLEKAKTQNNEQRIDAEIVNLLALLQEKGRFIDFIMDDVTAYDDAQVGAAARIVHQGCQSVVKEHFDINPILNNHEGESVTLTRAHSPEEYRVVGKVMDGPPFNGVLLHHGWKTLTVKLPRQLISRKSIDSQKVITPAEIELR